MHASGEPADKEPGVVEPASRREQPLRADDHHDHHGRAEDEHAGALELPEHVLEPDEQERAEHHARDAARAAQNHDGEQDDRFVEIE